MRKPLALLLALIMLGGCRGANSSDKPDLSGVEAALRLSVSPALLTSTPKSNSKIVASIEADGRYRYTDKPSSLLSVKDLMEAAASTEEVPEELVYARLDKLEVPDGCRPLGLIDSRHGYMLDAQRNAISIYDFGEQQHQPLIESGDGWRIAAEIAFNERWLIWIESAVSDNASASGPRPHRLLCLDLQDGAAQSVEINSGSTTVFEGSFLPFDSLGLDGDSLVYRYSEFKNGQRDTQVHLVDLRAMSRQTLMSASSAGGRMIMRCTIAEQCIAWDVQLVQEVEVAGLPSMQQSFYDLYYYKNDLSKLHSGEAQLKQIAQNRGYGFPLAYRNQIVVLSQANLSFENSVLHNDIVLISPDLNSAQVIVHTGSQPYYEMLYTYDKMLKTFGNPEERPTPVSFSEPQIGKRFLSWQSNVFDRHIVYDLHNLCFLELPLFFTAERSSQEGNYTSRYLPGLDADYRFFETVDGSENAYILRME